jgi:hypothetical protein
MAGAVGCVCTPAKNSYLNTFSGHELNGREHQQHRTDPEQHQREAIRAVLVGGPAGASIAATHRGVKEEPGCHQGNAEHLDGATHVSSLQVPELTTLT